MSVHAWHHLLSTPVEIMPDLCLNRDPEKKEQEEQTTAEKAMAKKEQEGEWML